MEIIWGWQNNGSFFDTRFCNVARGDENGDVENLTKRIEHEKRVMSFLENYGIALYHSDQLHLAVFFEK